MYIMSVYNVNTTSKIFTGVLYCIYSYMFRPHANVKYRRKPYFSNLCSKSVTAWKDRKAPRKYLPGI
jgi:hypothetical protein